MRLPKLLAGLAVASVALAACGTSGGTGQTIKGTIKIGIDLPVSGSDASDGQPTQNGAKLAVKLTGKVCGATGAPGHQLRGLLVVLLWKMPGLPSGLYFA